jgi:hypothetical protein
VIDLSSGGNALKSPAAAAAAATAAAVPVPSPPTVALASYPKLLTVVITSANGNLTNRPVAITSRLLTFDAVVRQLLPGREREFELQTEDGATLAGSVAEAFEGQKEARAFLRKAERIEV